VATVNRASVSIGSSVTATDDCFAPGQVLTAVLQSTTVPLGTVRSDALGRYSLTFLVPKAIGTGVHHIVVNGPGVGAAMHTSVGTITVLGSAVGAVSLPRTGLPRFVPLLLVLGGLGLILGSGLSLVTRRRGDHVIR
jgi:hypothetical protein